MDFKNKHVVILGGGDTAMDCCRTAIRQGATEVSVVYRRDRDSMPGSRKEVTNAIEEGINFMFNHTQVEVIDKDNTKSVGAIKLIKTQSSEPDSTGRSSLSTVEGSEFMLECDAVIVAFGFSASPEDWLASHNISTHDSGLINTQNNTLNFQTTNPKVFAGGDMVRGSSLVVEAINEGQVAAESIIDFLDC